jgi:hypothetical protein
MAKGDLKGGRPPFELSDEDFTRLVNMIRIQCTQEEICGVFCVTDKTLNVALKKRGESGFSELYKKHQDEGRSSLRRAQWKAANDGNPTMLVWLGKQVLGQRDKQELDHRSSDGTMTPPKTVVLRGVKPDDAS